MGWSAFKMIGPVDTRTNFYYEIFVLSLFYISTLKYVSPIKYLISFALTISPNHLYRKNNF
jgi:hypothetical protein